MNSIVIQRIAKRLVVPTLVFVLLRTLCGAGSNSTLNQALIKAAQQGDVAAVETLLAKGADVNGKDGNGSTALIHASAEGMVPIVELLVRNGADVNAADNIGDTALMAAASEGHADVLKLLLSAGANVNARDRNGFSAVGFAQPERPDIVGLLKAAGAEYTLVDAARHGNNREILRHLEEGADVNRREHTGRTALLQAVISEHPETVKLLVAKGADVNAPGSDGSTPLMMAAGSGQPGLVCFFLSKGADVHAKDSSGGTALGQAEFTACELPESQRLRAIITLLKAAGATNGSEPDCYTRARKIKHKEVVASKANTVYPKSAAAVVEAFLRAALRGVSITAEDLQPCTEVLDVQSPYLPIADDIVANCKRRVFQISMPMGPKESRFNIITGFTVRNVRITGKLANVTVVLRRVGWINQEGLQSALFGSHHPGRILDEKLSRILHITNDQKVLSIDLAKPAGFWRIIGLYEPQISVSSAVKILRCYLKHERPWLDAPPPFSRPCGSDQARHSNPRNLFE